MNSKAWWMSKTLWVNALAGLAMIIQALQGAPWFSPEAQAGALAVINVLLRLITGQPLSTKPGAGVIGLVLAVVLVSGCADMTAAQKRQATLIGMEVLAAGVAGMPGTDPTAAYWSKYAAGVLEKGNAANPTVGP